MSDDDQGQIIQEQIQANERMLRETADAEAQNQVSANERIEKQVSANERLDAEAKEEASEED